MSSQDPSLSIAERQEELQELESRMEDLCKRFKEDSAEYIAGFIERKANEYITEIKPKKLGSLNRQRQKELKLRISRLVENPKEITKKIDTPISPRELARLASSELGVVLEEYGYVRTKEDASVGHGTYSGTMKSIYEDYYTSEKKIKKLQDEIKEETKIIKRESEVRKAKQLWKDA